MRKAFLFSGQGSQYVGMARFFYDNFESSKKVLDSACSTLSKDLKRLMFDGPVEELGETTNTQPCVLAAEIMAFEALKELGYVPDAVAGFSLGEYGALYAAGVLDLESVLKIIDIRANAMKNAAKGVNGSMAAIMGCEPSKVFELCDKANGYVVPVNFNCVGQISISGENEAVDEVLALCKEEKIRAVKLQVSVPCHCKFMNSASEVIKAAFNGFAFNNPSLPLFMNVDGERESDANLIKEKLVRQIKEPVQWISTLNNLKEFGCDTFIECGPGKTLTTFVKRTLNNDEVSFTNTDGEESFNIAVNLLKGGNE